MYSSYSVAAAVCSCVFPSLATAFVALRFRGRSIKGQRYGIDDWLVVAALCLAIASCCIVLYGSFRASIGQDLRTITPPQFQNYQEHLFFDVIVSHLCYGVVKLSVLEFYKRIFDVHRFKMVAMAVEAFVVAWMITALFAQIFSSWPVEDYWLLGKYSINYGAYLTSMCVIDIFLDILILCLPLPQIRKLHVDRRRKFLIIGIFWMGIFCVIASAVRLYFSYELTSFSTTTATSNTWFSYISVNNVIWAEIESCCSIIAACLPCMGPVFGGIRSADSLFSSLRSRLGLRSRESSSMLVQQSNSNSNSNGPTAPLSWGLPQPSITSSVESGGKSGTSKGWYPLQDGASGKSRGSSAEGQSTYTKQTPEGHPTGFHTTSTMPPTSDTWADVERQ